jgi:hypothetical protein
VKITTTNLVPSRKAAFVMPTSCTSVRSAHRGGAWAGDAEFTGEVSVMTVADRDRTAATLAATDQLVPGATAWGPPT